MATEEPVPNDYERALEAHRVNGCIRRWEKGGDGYTVTMMNTQNIFLSNGRDILVFCWGIETSSQAWRNARPGYGNSPVEAADIRFSADLKESTSALGAELLDAAEEASGATPEVILEQLEEWRRNGAINYVLPAEPLGDSWVIGCLGPGDTPFMVPIGYDRRSAREGAAAFLAGLSQGSMWAAKKAIKTFRPDLDLGALFRQP